MIDTIFSLFERRELLWQFLVRNVKSQHRGSVLGAMWLIFNPLMMLGLYVFVFGIVFGGRFTGSPNETTLDFALGVFLGLNILGIIQGIIGSSPSIIVSQPNFVKKVVFPLEILPAAAMGALAYNLIIGFGLCLLGVLILGSGLNLSVFYFPIIIAPVFLMALGLSWFLSALGFSSVISDRLVLFWDLPCCTQVESFTQLKRQRQPHRQFGNFFNGTHYCKLLILCVR